MSATMLARRTGLLAPRNRPELMTMQWHVGVALDPDPAFSTETRNVVKKFLKQTGASGMQIVFLRTQLRFARYGCGEVDRNEAGRAVDQELLDALNDPGAALRLVRLRRSEWMMW